MSLEALRLVFASSATGLTRLVALEIANHHNSITGQCDPRVSVLADETGLKKISIVRHIAEGVRMGLFTVVPNPTDERKNTYRFPGLRIFDYPDSAPSKGISKIPNRRKKGIPEIPNSPPKGNSEIPKKVSQRYLKGNSGIPFDGPPYIKEPVSNPEGNPRPLPHEGVNGVRWKAPTMKERINAFMDEEERRKAR